MMYLMNSEMEKKENWTPEPIPNTWLRNYDLMRLTWKQKEENWTPEPILNT